jgi:O-succinylhomoserine sulfhydrylase
LSKQKKQTGTIRNTSPQSKFKEHSTPLYMTSSFTFDNAEHGRALFAEEVDGNIYTRFSNPNTTEFVQKMVFLEKMEDGFAFASGMAAIFASMAGLLKSGDHIIASRAVFGSTHQILTQILPKWNITHTYIDVDKPEDWEKAITADTKMLFIETPSNPGLDLVDLEHVAHIKKKYDLILNVDNTFATPHLQIPADFGADLVTHSATKYLDGQGRVISGVVVGKNELIKEVRFFARHTGPCLSPFNAWILTRSLETLGLRMDKTCENAIRITEFLESHTDIEQVKYPFSKKHPQYHLAIKQMKAGGGIVSFIVKGGYDRARKLLDATKMISLTANLGDTRTILTHPASTTHSKLSDFERKQVGIMPGLIRISAGIEDISDIIEDLKQAIERTK